MDFSRLNASNRQPTPEPGSSRSPVERGTQPTPAMRQYLEAKRAHPDALLFFRMGDFYEMFFEDALVGARVLELTLTSRSKEGAGIPMCGVPYHAVDTYLTRLVKKGFRVAICEQVEDPRVATGVVKREVVRVVSPGTLTDESYLEAREPSFLMALCGDATGIGAALLDVSTGEFLAAEYPGETGRQGLIDDLAILRPKELLVPGDWAGQVQELIGSDGGGAVVRSLDGWTFEPARAEAILLEQFRAASLDGFGLTGHARAIAAAGALVQHLQASQKLTLSHVRAINFRQSADGLALDASTLRHLEIVEALDGQRAGSLVGELDRTVTVMGGRLLRSWLLKPLVVVDAIRERLDAVEDLAFHTRDRGKLRDALKVVHDLERIIGRVALGASGPRDLVAIKQSLIALPRIRAALSEVRAPLLLSLVAALDEVADVRDSIARLIVDEPPALAREGGFIRDGVDEQIDTARQVSRSGRQTIAQLEEHERARTGIASLKIRYNRVFGYYIEVSRSNLHAVPPDYIRKQTIAGGERFVTPSLKDYEESVLGADELIVAREVVLFDALTRAVSQESVRIQETARVLATLDVLAAYAETALACNYTKPQVHDADDFTVVDGRHPVVERHCRHPFVPNDVTLNDTTHQLMVLTGPNMGGKSTYLRQTALIALMAQAGSFVPAREAKLAIVDRIFTRVGAGDNIARGQSTFMAEMQETARILHAATRRSLVLLDEIGRGTATFDGLSIAWAVAEHLSTTLRARPKTLFATHYHELTELADQVPGVFNCHVAAREWNDDIVFLRKVLPGRADRSYGIQVARLAGLPPPVIARAREILNTLEQEHLARGTPTAIANADATPAPQLPLFTSPGERVIDRLRSVDVNQLTPLQALTLLADLKNEAGG